MADGNQSWRDFIPKLRGWITGFIAFVSAVVGFIKLWRGDTGLVTIVVLAAGILGCVYLALRYPRWRRRAVVGLVVIFLVAAGGVGYHFYQ